MSTILFHNAMLVNEGSVTHGWLLTDGDKITRIGHGDLPEGVTADEINDCDGAYIMPGRPIWPPRAARLWPGA